MPCIHMYLFNVGRQLRTLLAGLGDLPLGQHDPAVLVS